MRARTINSHTGLRGIAALAVLMTHVMCEKKVSFGVTPYLLFIFNWPDQAVDLFFILSGFILNWVYYDKISFSWGEYIVARCARILPLYYLTLLTFLPPYFATFRIMGWMYENGKVLKVFIANLLLVAGFMRGNHIDWVLNVPSWSISIEFFAYLFIFPVLVFINRKFSLEMVCFVCAICLTGLSMCYILGEKYLMGWDWTRSFRGFFGFPLGFFICTLFKNSKSLSVKFIDGWLFSLMSIFLLSTLNILPIYLITLVSPWVVYFSAFDNGFFCEILKKRVLRWLGDRSYSIYLWHCPIIYVLFIPNINIIDSHLKWSEKWLGWVHVGMILLAVGITAEVSFKFFESPIRKLAHRK